MTYRSDMEALAARKQALDAEIKARTKERDEAERMVKDGIEKLRLPVLENVVVAAPCKASWSNMKGDERARHCAKCDQTVYDLSALTRDQAESLIREKNGSLCARYYKRADGTILTKDCAVGARRRRRTLAVVAGAAATLIGVGVHAASQREEHVMGSIAYRALPTQCEQYVAELRELKECGAIPAEAAELLEQSWVHLEITTRKHDADYQDWLRSMCTAAHEDLAKQRKPYCSEHRDQHGGHNGNRE